MRRLRTCAFILAGLILAACEPTASPGPTPSSPTVKVAPEPIGASLGEQRQAQTYLDRGLVALQNDRLLTPESDNAFMWFNKALEILPDYERALDGIERIVERYLQLATQAIAGDAYGRARIFIDRARVVSPDYPQIAQVEEKLERMQRAERRNLALGSQALKARSARLATELVAFGRHAREEGKLVRIYVPSDDAGRWVYEQLSRSLGERRIRADIVTSPPYRVQILTFNP